MFPKICEIDPLMDSTNKINLKPYLIEYNKIKINLDDGGPCYYYDMCRSGHASAYDKNLDDQVRPTVVPDDLIQPLSDKYWAPDPHTGVFGPATESAGRVQDPRSSLSKGSLNSVLEETAWFRPTSIEDLEKPHHH